MAAIPAPAWRGVVHGQTPPLAVDGAPAPISVPAGAKDATDVEARDAIGEILAVLASLGLVAVKGKGGK